MRLPVALIALVIFISCADRNISSTNTKKSEKILTSRTWISDEIRVQLSNNTTAFYKKGGNNNTVDYSTDSLKFFADHTGRYYYLGNEYTTTWNFIDAEKSKMTLIIDYPNPVTVNLEYVNVSKNYLKYTQYVTAGGVSYLATATRVPR